MRRVLADLWDLASIAAPGAGIAAACGAVAAAVSGSWWLVCALVLRLRVHAPNSFEMYAAHLPRPTIVGRPSEGSARFTVCREEARRLAVLAASVPHTVVAGDLNLSDRQSEYRSLVRGRLDVMRTVWAGNTFQAHRKHAYWRLFAMRIDHLVVPAGWAVSDARVVRVSGSDHRAVCATISPPADPDRRAVIDR